MRLPEAPAPAPPPGVHATSTQIETSAKTRTQRRSTGTNIRRGGSRGPRMITLSLMPGATISPVKIRAVTFGLDLPVPEVVNEPFEAAAGFLAAARQAFEADGIEVQTTRLAGPDLGPHLGRIGERFNEWALHTEQTARECGIEYLSLGRLPAASSAVVAEHAAPVLAATE